MATTTTTVRAKASRSPARRASDRAAAARVFHALSDETRLAILEMLGAGERCVCDLQDALDAAQSRLSFHLRVLKDADLVTDRKEGRWSYYALAGSGLVDAQAYVALLATVRPAGASALVGLARATDATRAAARSGARAPRAAPADACCD